MNNDNITPEFAEKAKGKTAEEIIALAQEKGVELTDEQLDAVSGGVAWSDEQERYADCPYCGNSVPTNRFTGSEFEVVCNKCQGVFWVSRSD